MLTIEKQKRIHIATMKNTHRINEINASELLDSLSPLVKNAEITLIFNLDGILFIDTEGFKVLAEIADLAGEHNTKFMLANTSSEVFELIRIMELENRFDYCRNLHAELEKYEASSI